jgi:hypothetical protein
MPAPAAQMFAAVDFNYRGDRPRNLQPARNLTAMGSDVLQIAGEEKRIFYSLAGLASVAVPVEIQFERLAREWKSETFFQSSTSMKMMHPAYQRIIGLGWPVVPSLLNALRQRPDFWFEALHAITGAQPVTYEHAGDVAAMTNDWLLWGQQRGFIT